MDGGGDRITATLPRMQHYVVKVSAEVFPKSKCRSTEEQVQSPESKRWGEVGGESASSNRLRRL